MRSELLSKVVAASGLSAIFAERTIERALRRAGVDPENLSRTELKQGLAELERVLATFMDPADAAARIAKIRRLAE